MTNHSQHWQSLTEQQQVEWLAKNILKLPFVNSESVTDLEKYKNESKNFYTINAGNPSGSTVVKLYYFNGKQFIIYNPWSPQTDQSHFQMVLEAIYISYQELHGAQ